ncbi:MAG: class I SAM-dependent methyltransferase [Solirubrobacterales bacterium]
MSSDVQYVHPTRRSEKLIALLGSAVMRSGANRWLRSLMLGVARPTYTRSLRVVPSRLELPFVLNARGLTGPGVEIGVEEGLFSAYLLEYWRGMLISVDPWREMAPEEYKDTCNTSQASMEERYETTCKRLAPFGERSQIWRETSAEAAARLSLGSLDFVYLDARHDYDGVSEDLELFFPLVRAGGLIAGHDYNDGVFVEGVHGVRSAVDRFFGERGIPVRHTYTDLPNASWMVRVPSGHR